MTLPELGESVTEGTVSRWLKQVGESVKTDEPLLEVSTDKVDTEIPSPAAGTLLEIRVQEDETVEVGAVLAVIGEAGAAPPAQEGASPSSAGGCRARASADPAACAAASAYPASRAEGCGAHAQSRRPAGAARPSRRRSTSTDTGRQRL